MFYLSDMNDLDMTCGDFVHALKMLICSEKHPISRANHGHTEKVVTVRGPMRLYQQYNFLQILIYSTIF